MTGAVGLEEAPDPRFLSSGDEAGTPTGDRKFRPDVQGLRAIAILLVVLFHAGVPGVTGGYVGVDVFFVISGFVITGVLLRERESSGRTSIVSFYARRARRIIPAATLVIVASVIGAYVFIGSATGRDTAVDGQWASVFLANFHFAATQTNYLASLKPPSPLQNFWSLAVEEQFYVVYPTIFMLLALLRVTKSVRLRIGLFLAAVVVGSFVLSVLMTSSNPAAAFFSPFTRAWELALGGLIAVSGEALRKLPHAFAAVATWVGLGAVVVAAFAFTSATSYPGSAVALPVLGTGLIIAGGAAQPAGGAEWLLARRPFQLLGLISYSLYLWHWPILMIGAERKGLSSLPVWDNVLLLGLSLVLAVITYLLLENPVRHARRLRSRSWASVLLGVTLIAVSLVSTTAAVASTKPLPTGGIGNAAVASNCPVPRKHLVTRLRHTYLAQHPSPAGAGKAVRRQRMVVIGDSTSCTLLPGLSAVAPSYGVQVVDGAVQGCGIVSDTLAPQIVGNLNFHSYTRQCKRNVRRVEAAVLASGKPDVVLWGSTDEGSSIIDPPSGTQVLDSGTPRWRSVMLDRIDARVQTLLATGAKVVMLLEPAKVHSNQPGVDAGDKQTLRMNELLRTVAARYPTKVGVVDLASRVCPSGPPCPYAVDTLVPRADNLHYDAETSLWVAEWLMPRIAATAASLH
jgi:peptidoglycan/LPS O-acetylase OafA/YrhL